MSGRFYTKFISAFEENLSEIYIVPKIIVFTSSKKTFLKKNKNYDEKKKNSFYYLGGIKTSIEEIINFLMKPLNKIETNKDKEAETQLTFEYIDKKEKLVLPLLYQSLIELNPEDNVDEYTEFLWKKYSTNKEIDNLMKQIKYITNIPIKLICKYYARLYTLQSPFYSEINKDLRENKKDKYLTYIKVLYEGIKLKSLQLASDKVLYRGSKISNNEIIKLKVYLKNKIEGLPGAIVFSKSFLSFSKDKLQAEKFLNMKNIDKNLSKVLFIIEKDEIIDYSLSTHSDIENISKYPSEKEVLFFPYSSFEIKENKKTKNDNDENYYEIKLLYLGKYIKEIEKLDGDIKVPEDSLFKKEIIGLIPQKKIEVTTTKTIIKNYKEYKYNIINNIFKDKNNEKK